MASNYPGSLDNFSTSHADGVNETIHASTVNDLADAVNKIESTLGTNPVFTSNFSAVRTVTASTTATSTDYQILADATSAGLTVTLPSAPSVKGQRLLIRKIDSTTNHAVTINPGSATIDGVSGNIFLRTQYQLVELVSDGSNWQRVQSLFGQVSVYYVDATYGNDSYSGHFPWAAKKTISAAVTAAGSQSTILVAPGTYVETVNLNGHNNVTLRGNYGGGQGLFGSVIQAPNATASCIITGFGAGGLNLLVEGLTLVGSSDFAYTGTLLNADGGNFGCMFRDLVISGYYPGYDSTEKSTVGVGTYGGTGILVTGEQQMFSNIRLTDCNIGLQIGDGTQDTAQLSFRDIFFASNWIHHKEVICSFGGPGDITFDNSKSENCFTFGFAIAQLASNGSNPADGDTVHVRDQTYRFKNTMALANDVKIGATIDATLLSLVHAVNGTGTVGTDYFTGTVKPTGTKAGWVNLVDFAGANGYTNDAVDTTRHACTFQLTDTLGPAGNSIAFTVSSTNLSDYFGLGTFSRAEWCHEIQQMEGRYSKCSWAENISLQNGNAMLVAGNYNRFELLGLAPETQASVTGDDNVFDMPKLLNKINIQSGAARNWLVKPHNGDTVAPGTTRIVDNGTSTVITLT